MERGPEGVSLPAGRSSGPSVLLCTCACRYMDVPECAHHMSMSTRERVHMCRPPHACPPVCVCASLGTPASPAAFRWTIHAFTKGGDGLHHLAATPAWVPASRGSFSQPSGRGSTWKRKGESPAASFGLGAVSLSQPPAEGKWKCGRFEAWTRLPGQPSRTGARRPLCVRRGLSPPSPHDPQILGLPRWLTW